MNTPIDRFDEMFPHGIYELPEFVERVTGVSPRGDVYVGIAINKEDIKSLIKQETSRVNREWRERIEGMKITIDGMWKDGVREEIKSLTDEEMKGYNNAISDLLNTKGGQDE